MPLLSAPAPSPKLKCVGSPLGSACAVVVCMDGVGCATASAITRAVTPPSKERHMVLVRRYQEKTPPTDPLVGGRRGISGERYGRGQPGLIADDSRGVAVARQVFR